MGKTLESGNRIQFRSTATEDRDPESDQSISEEWSYVSGPKTPPLAFVTISQMLRETVSRFGEREAIVSVHQKLRRTYRQFNADIDELAAGLLALGLEKGDRLGIWAPNCYEWVLTQLATARIGVVLVNINPAYRLAEVEYALNKVGCKTIVVAEQFKTSRYLDMIRELAPELENCMPARLKSEKLPQLQIVIAISTDPGPGVLSFDAVKNSGGVAHKELLAKIEETLDPNDAINVQFTSGTTGMPKGATLSHYNIVNNARFVTDRIAMTETDRLCIPVPLYHCFGMVMGVLGVISKGATMIFPADGFDADSTMSALSEERCTAAYGVPTMFVSLLDVLDRNKHDLDALRTGIMAGAPCPVEIMERVIAEMNMGQVTICYGMTETSPVSFQSFLDDPVKLRCETVGRVHPHLDVKIVDEAGEIVRRGEQGELCTRGYSVMKKYWDDDENTANSVRDGWMHTGDLATIDADGFCRITGRVKDMIIRGGENIYPREIEEFLFRHPDVSQAQVFGIPDQKFGEVVCAWVMARPGADLSEDDVVKFCKGQIAHYKVPQHVRLVPEIPMTITGKPQKFVMREKMLEMLEKEA
ncbi:MAG: AMP-binding protein [Pseudomonadota bacterium]